MLNEQRSYLSGRFRGPRGGLGLLVSALLLFGAFPVQAGTLDIVVESTMAAPGTNGQFDVLLENNSASAVTIGAFSVDVLLSSTTAVSFTAIDNATTAPYIFSITGSFPPGFMGNILPMEVAGNDLAASGGQVVNPGDTWGLANVSYMVDSAAALGTVVGLSLEPVPVFLPPPGGTSLADDQGNPVDFNTVNGTITIQNASAVPEPAAVTLLGISGVILLAAARIARRGTTRPDRD